MTFWIGAVLALAGVAGLGYSVIVYVANRRDPHVDQMGTSIAFDRAWITAAIVASMGAVLLFSLPWSWAFGFIVIAYVAIMPVKLLLRRMFVTARRLPRESMPDTSEQIGELRCPVCGVVSEEPMPADACVYFWTCPACATRNRPRAGDCCVFCSYGDVPCPPARQARA